MEQANNKEVRVPVWIESQRGDDRMGTAPDGKIISDHDAAKQGIPFTEGVPAPKVQKVVEEELKKDNWVHIEKTNGDTELLTKGDLPQEEDIEASEEDESEQEEETGKEEVVPEWKQGGFGVQPEKAKVEKAKDDKKPVTTTQCTPIPKTPKEEWKSKFTDVKSAMATHKNKPG